jgi:hypothetical protein
MGNEEMAFWELMQFGSTVQRKKREKWHESAQPLMRRDFYRE